MVLGTAAYLTRAKEGSLPLIYLNNISTTTKKPPQVTEAVIKAMTTMGNASRGTHGSALEASRVLYDTRRKLADFFGCSRADHVIFTSGGTEALNIAINGIAKPNSHILVSSHESETVLTILNHIQANYDWTIDFFSAEQDGTIDISALSEKLCPQTCAIICSPASSLTGIRIDLKTLGNYAHEHGLLFLADATWTAGFCPVHMEHDNIDILCFSGHRGLMGPQGTGGLCIRPGTDIRPLKVGGSGVQSYSKTHPLEYPARLEAGTLNSHGIAGLSAALDFLLKIGPESIYQHQQALMKLFIHNAASLNHVNLWNSVSSASRLPMISLSVDGLDSETLARTLMEQHGIAVDYIPNRIPRPEQMQGTNNSDTVQFSFSWFNTKEEIEQAIAVLQKIYHFMEESKWQTM